MIQITIYYMVGLCFLEQYKAMDWTLCAICQEKTLEPLSSPQHSANWRDPLCVYRDFIENLTEFEKLNAVSVKSGIALADVSERSEEAFLRNKAL